MATEYSCDAKLKAVIELIKLDHEPSDDSIESASRSSEAHHRDPRGMNTETPTIDTFIKAVRHACVDNDWSNMELCREAGNLHRLMGSDQVQTASPHISPACTSPKGVQATRKPNTNRLQAFSADYKDRKLCRYQPDGICRETSQSKVWRELFPIHQLPCKARHGGRAVMNLETEWAGNPRRREKRTSLGV